MKILLPIILLAGFANAQGYTFSKQDADAIYRAFAHTDTSGEFYFMAFLPDVDNPAKAPVTATLLHLVGHGPKGILKWTSLVHGDTQWQVSAPKGDTVWVQEQLEDPNIKRAPYTYRNWGGLRLKVEMETYMGKSMPTIRLYDSKNHLQLHAFPFIVPGAY